MNTKKYKAISWKTAFSVVVFLHLIGYGAVTQYSSYRKKLTKDLKESREKLYTGKKTKQEWNNDNLKPVVVTSAPPQKIKESISLKFENKKLISNSTNSVLTSFNNIKNTFQAEVKKVDSSISKEIKTMISQPTKNIVKIPSQIKVVPKLIDKKICNPQLTVKPIQITPRPQNIQITNTPKPQVKTRNIIIKSDGVVVETSQETREVVSSRVIL